MDVKASARAKHASSQRGRARHSTRKHQPQQQKKQAQEVIEPQQHDVKKDSKLPSNWSRYEEEEDEGAAVKNNFASAPSVKSKGANYRDLLAEKSMLQGPDLAIGRRRLMLTHGQELRSQFTDMEKLWTITKEFGEEENFFTLDLDFIREELANLDVAERLLLDPEYACVEEMSDSPKRISGAGTVEELSGRSSSVECSSSLSALDTEDRDETTSAENTKAVKDNFADIKFFGRTGAAAEWSENNAGTFLNRHREMSDSDMQPKDVEDHVVDSRHLGKTVVSEWTQNYSGEFSNIQNKKPGCDMPSLLQDPSMPLTKAMSSFDAKSAEAELDSLLDMLDNKASGQVSSVMPMQSLGIAIGPSVLASKTSYPDILEPGNALDFHEVNTANDILSMPNVRASSASSRQTVGLTNDEVKFTTQDAGTSKSGSNLEDDFDKWLDSL